MLAARANELADDLGNLINRTITLVGRFRPEGVRPACLLPEKGHDFREAIDRAQPTTETALDHFEFRAAAAAVWKIVIEANRFVSETRPWELAQAEHENHCIASDSLDGVLTLLLSACRVIANELDPFLPNAAARIEQVINSGDAELGRALFPQVRIEA